MHIMACQASADIHDMHVLPALVCAGFQDRREDGSRAVMHAWQRLEHAVPPQQQYYRLVAA